MNDSGLVVGISASLPDFSDSIATTWSGGFASTIPGINGVSAAWAVNSAGEIVGETTVDGLTGTQPFSFVNGVVTYLPLPDFTFTNGAAYGLNDRGDIVGTAFKDGIRHAIVWRNGVAIDLGNFTDNDDIGEGDASGDIIATGANSYGEVVGTQFTTLPDDANSFDDWSGFIWKDGQLTDLNDVTNLPTGWTIIKARSINEYGQIAATAALDFGRESVRGCILTPIVNLTSFTAPSTATAGTTVVGRLTLNTRALQGGAVVTLTSSDPATASVPATVAIPPLGTSATFSISAHFPTVDRTVILTASYNGVQITTPVVIQTTNPHLSGFVISPNPTYDGQIVTGTVTLRSPAPPAGVRVTFTNTNSAVVTVPSSLTIPHGATTKVFTSTVHAPTGPVTSTIIASLSDVSISQVLNVHPITLQSFDLNVSEVTGGATIQGVVRIPVQAPSGGYRVTLLSSNTAAATVPASVTIPYRSMSTPVLITTKPVSGTTFLNISATHGSTTISRQIQVSPPEVNTFTLNTHQIRGGSRVTGTVTLTGKAPTGGVTVHILAYPDLVSPVSTPVLVHAGSTSVSFSMNTSVVSSPTVVSLTASTFNVQKSTTLTLTR